MCRRTSKTEVFSHCNTCTCHLCIDFAQKNHTSSFCDCNGLSAAAKLPESRVPCPPVATAGSSHPAFTGRSTGKLLEFGSSRVREQIMSNRPPHASRGVGTVASLITDPVWHRDAQSLAVFLEARKWTRSHGVLGRLRTSPFAS